MVIHVICILRIKNLYFIEFAPVPVIMVKFRTAKEMRVSVRKILRETVETQAARTPRICPLVYLSIHYLFIY